MARLAATATGARAAVSTAETPRAERTTAGSAQHVEAYLDESSSASTGGSRTRAACSFYRLIQNAVVVKKLDDDDRLVAARRAGKRRGPQPKPKAKRAPKGRAAVAAKKASKPVHSP